jgi:hypothetical protein
MTFDDTAAAYGLVQVVFADVADHLAFALFTLRQKKDATASVIKPSQFGRILSEFKTELRQFEHVQSLDSAVADLRKCCQELKALSKWRNERIHARVRQVGDGFALYNAETGERLSINHVECNEISQRLAGALVTLDTNVPALVNNLDFEKEFQAFWKQQLVDAETTDSEQGSCQEKGI